MPRPEVHVIGGGLSGLTAAVYLKRHSDCHVRVFEAANQFGGQVASWEDEDGDPIETGLHMAFPWYRNLSRLYEDVGAPLNLVETDGNYYILDGQTGEVGAARGGLNLLESLYGVATFPGLPPADRLQLARMVGSALRMSEQELLALDGMSVAEWLAARQATPALERQLSVASVTIQGLRPEKASATSFLKFLRHLFGAKGDHEAAYFDAPLQEALIAPLTDFLRSRQAMLHPGTPVDHIEVGYGRPVATRFAGGWQAEPDHVVLAVPGHQVPGLLPPELRDRSPFAELRGMTSATVYCLQLFYDQRVMEDGNTRVSNRRRVIFDGVCDKAYHWKEHGGGSVLQVLIDDATDLEGRTDEAIYEDVLRDLARFFPDCRRVEPTKWTLMRHDRIYCETRPGYWARVPRRHETPIQGLYLAGDYTDGPYHYGMDSAVISGKRVARQILAHEGAPDLPDPPLPVERPGWL